MALDSAIASRHLISYNELANTAGIPSPHRIHKLTKWLETLVAIDLKLEKPLRAAWVVSRQRGQIPAPGFFMKCTEMGQYAGPSVGTEAEEFHRELLARHLP